jgi:CRP-like cAMP-binding protein
MSDLKDFLLHSDWMSGLPDGLCVEILAQTTVRSFKEGELICEQGGADLSWLGVIEGMVAVESSSPAGRQTTLAIVMDGNWFGEGAILKRQGRPYSVSALRPSRVAHVPQVLFERALQQSWQLSRYVLDQLNARCGHYVAQLENRRNHDRTAWVAFCLADLVQSSAQGRRDGALELGQEEIGRLCGLSRQITNQVLRELLALGLVAVRYRSIRILDVQGLQAVARGLGTGHAST